MFLNELHNNEVFWIASSIRKLHMYVTNVFYFLLVFIIFATSTHANEKAAEVSADHADEVLEEEVTVTGTYIRRSVHDMPSPLTVLDETDIGTLAANDIKDIIQTLSFNSGSLGLSSSSWVGDDGSSGNASINLRNLGNGATLVLINGRRAVSTNYDDNGGGYVDIQGLLPNIALERIEVVKDGASALYGADAVAGVVNFLTHKAFRGVELQIDLSSDYETWKQQDHMLSVLVGTGHSDVHVLLSGSFLERGSLTYGDRYDRFGRSGLSSFGQPGRYVPLHADDVATPVESNYWWPQGGADPQSFSGSLPDLECEKVAAEDGLKGTLGIHPDFPHICVYDYSSFFSIVQPETQGKIYSDMSWQITPMTELYGSVSYSRLKSSNNNSLYPHVRYAILPEHHFGLQLDAARRGFAPVPYQAMQRLLGGTENSSYDDRPLNTVARVDRTNKRLVLGSRSVVQFFDRDWSIDKNIIFSQQRRNWNLPTDTLWSRMELAFEGFGGPNCDSSADTPGPGSGNLGTGSCYYYNSFQTSVYDPVTGEKWDASNTSLWAADPTITIAEAARKYQNPRELLQWLHGTFRASSNVEQLVLDYTMSSSLFEVIHGLASLAAGGQYRRDSTQVDYNQESNAFNYSFLTGDRDWNNRIRSWSLFFEILIPVVERVKLTAAIRYENIETFDLDTVDPKLSLLVQPNESLIFRFSWGTSFKVGSLLQTGGSRTLFRNSSDPFSNAPSLAYRASAATGNPNLKPEIADVFNVGISWEPEFLQGLNIDFDFYGYDYSELIVREGHQELIDRDNALRCPNGVNNDPEAGPLCGVWDHNGDGIVTVFSIGEGLPDKVVRREDGYLVRTEASYFNAPSLKTSGLDFTVTYQWHTDDYGDFKVATSASKTFSYDIVLANGQSIDGLGSRNVTNSIGRSMPAYRSYSSLTWSHKNHFVALSVQTISSYDDDSMQSRFLGAYIGYAESIDSMTTMNIQYRMRFESFISLSGVSQLTLGIKNLFNQEPPLVQVDGAFDYYTHDARGRIYYVRYRLSQ